VREAEGLALDELEGEAPGKGTSRAEYEDEGVKMVGRG